MYAVHIAHAQRAGCLSEWAVLSLHSSHNLPLAQSPTVSSPPFLAQPLSPLLPRLRYLSFPHSPMHSCTASHPLSPTRPSSNSLPPCLPHSYAPLSTYHPPPQTHLPVTPTPLPTLIHAPSHIRTNSFTVRPANLPTNLPPKSQRTCSAHTLSRSLLNPIAISSGRNATSPPPSSVSRHLQTARLRRHPRGTLSSRYFSWAAPSTWLFSSATW